MTGDDLEHLARLDAPLSDEERAQAATEIRRLRRALRDAYDALCQSRAQAALGAIERALW